MSSCGPTRAFHTTFKLPHIISSGLKWTTRILLYHQKRVIDEEYANRALDASNFYIVPWRIALSCIKDASARLAGVTI